MATSRNMPARFVSRVNLLESLPRYRPRRARMAYQLRICAKIRLSALSRISTRKDCVTKTAEVLALMEAKSEILYTKAALIGIAQTRLTSVLPRLP